MIYNNVNWSIVDQLILWQIDRLIYAIIKYSQVCLLLLYFPPLDLIINTKHWSVYFLDNCFSFLFFPRYCPNPGQVGKYGKNRSRDWQSVFFCSSLFSLPNTNRSIIIIIIAFEQLQPLEFTLGFKMGKKQQAARTKGNAKVSHRTTR